MGKPDLSKGIQTFFFSVEKDDVRAHPGDNGNLQQTRRPKLKHLGENKTADEEALVEIKNENG